MAEPWPVIPPFHKGHSWAVDDGNELWTTFNTEAEARRYAALPVLIETIRKGCDAERCIFCGWDWRDCVQHRPSDCPGIAALKAAGEKA